MNKKVSDHIVYESETVRTVYDKRYSGFSFLPGFSNEEKRIRRIFSNLFNKYSVTPSTLNSFLDLGCGFGLKTYILSGFFKQSKGIDFSSTAIQIASLLNDKKNLNFETGDIHQPTSDEKFDIVTALGLSVLNISEVQKYAEEVSGILKNYIRPGGIFIIHSFTDFSGTAPSGWYNFTSGELKEILTLLRKEYLSVQIYFPHKDISNYFGFGMENLMKELYKLLQFKKKDYYIIIRTK